MPDNFSRRVLLSLDAEDYSSRNDVQQREVQQALVDVIRTAAEDAGFDRSRWSVQSAGDGELSVLPPGTPEPKLIDDFTTALAGALAVHNGAARDARRLRLRLALHQGVISRAAGGYAGQGVVTVSRMVDSAVGRRALIACPTADLVVVVSSSLFTEFVAQGHTSLSAKDFRQVTLTAKKFTTAAWLHVPGHDVHVLPLDEPATGASPAAPEPSEPRTETERAGVTTIVHGGVHTQEAVFGIKNVHR